MDLASVDSLRFIVFLRVLQFRSRCEAATRSCEKGVSNGLEDEEQEEKEEEEESEEGGRIA